MERDHISLPRTVMGGPAPRASFGQLSRCLAGRHPDFPDKKIKEDRKIQGCFESTLSSLPCKADSWQKWGEGFRAGLRRGNPSIAFPGHRGSR